MKHAETTKLMGRMVLVQKVLERQKDYGVTSDGGSLVASGMKAWWEEKEIEPRTGWVVGFRNLQNGHVRTGARPGWGIDGYDPGEPNEWKTKSVTRCVLVAFWPTQKPVHVPLDGYLALAKGRRYLDREWIRKSQKGALRTAPDPYPDSGGWAKHPEWRKELSDIMKEDMKDWPRDERGRWLKR